MRTANIVYWYGQEDMPHDGGGLRALAWHSALQDLGYDASIIPLRSSTADARSDSWIRKGKRLFIPMPFAAKIPAMRAADVNIISVPAVFRSAAATLPRQSLIFDWMDRWSVNARTMGKSTLLSRPGGYFQSQIWARREVRLASSPAVNVYAGYEDKSSNKINGSSSFWIPTPITANDDNRSAQDFKLIKRVGFIGNFNYPPNVVSLKRFFKCYGAQFSAAGLEVIVGGFGSEIVNEWDVKAKVLGQVDSLADFYNSIDAAIVPIEHGGGIKAKAVEALAYGVPVFGTDHVAAGFSPAWGRYLGHLDDLLSSTVTVPATVPPEVFREYFSQNAFRNSVSQVVGRLRAVEELV